MSTAIPAPDAPPRRRRRPTGQPPPLPKELGRSGRLWVAMFIALALFLIFLLFLPIGASMERAENAFLRRLVTLRSDPLDS
ncbi:MAG TPA: hypothetical protein VF097_09585, partial [Actinomycetota bacterium]